MATATTNLIGLTGDGRVDGLLQGSGWQFAADPHVITYSFSLNDSSAGAWNNGIKAAVQQRYTVPAKKD